ncbi:hypothetical protein SCHPADRAFT_845287 [Schizopora paradoxa]|uniref:Spindle pole body component n=1 Tax=Schizopora paradoxa TaxID=27342 RepID=A0A0H2S2I9_9AGAM|nr:hypothetical protein SCHPADRAFT_845287 [Schizopora paradoxa]
MSTRMDPYTTPRPRSSTARKNKLTLSSKQYNKITDTIASVRRGRLNDDGEHALQDVEELPSFISEKSFISAPLNSRVPSTSSATTGHAGINGKGKGKGKGKVPSLDKVPVEVQEALILEDLLFVLTGIEGTYVTYHADYSPEDENPLHGIRFAVSSSLDPSLRDLVERMLPLATYYTSIIAFIEERSHQSYGLVNHALCAAMRDMLRDYHTLMSQLEHAFTSSSAFSLQKLWFYIHPTLHTLSLLSSLVAELCAADESPESSGESDDESETDEEERARNEALGLASAKKLKQLGNDGEANGSSSAGPAIGGEVLAILHARKLQLSGDPSALTLYTDLLRAAGKPYSNMLENWIWQGRLGTFKGDADGSTGDIYSEFCVKEARGVDKGILVGDYTDEYWERRFSLRDGSSLSSARLKAGVPQPRTPGGRLPGGSCIPPFLEPWKHKILLAGKYLNVLQECGIAVHGRQDSEAMGNADGMDGEKFYKSIDSAYGFANSSLVHLLLHDQKLLMRLRYLRRLFFGAESDWLSGFLATPTVLTELRKPTQSVRLSRLQGLADGAFATSGMGNMSKDNLGHSYDEGIRIELAKTTLYEWLLKIVNVNGVIGAGPGEEEGGHSEENEKEKLMVCDAFVLDYNVPFPLSLVISRKTIVRYQFLFRFLLHLRLVQSSLCSMWVDQKGKTWKAPYDKGSSVKGGASRPPSRATAASDDAGPDAPPAIPQVERWRRRVLHLRAKMLAFIQHVMAFITYEVLEPNWRKLEAKLSSLANSTANDKARAKEGSVEELLRDHVDFLDTCLKESMLTSSKLLTPLSKLITTCSTYTQYSKTFSKSAEDAANEAGDDESKMEKRWKFLEKFETNFNHWFNLFQHYVRFCVSSENGALLPLVSRLESVQTTG